MNNNKNLTKNTIRITSAPIGALIDYHCHRNAFKWQYASERYHNDLRMVYVSLSVCQENKMQFIIFYEMLMALKHVACSDRSDFQLFSLFSCGTSLFLRNR